MASLRIIGALAAFVILTWVTSLPLAHTWDERVTIWLRRAAPAPEGVASALVLLGRLGQLDL